MAKQQKKGGFTDEEAEDLLDEGFKALADGCKGFAIIVVLFIAYAVLFGKNGYFPNFF